MQGLRSDWKADVATVGRGWQVCVAKCVLPSIFPSIRVFPNESTVCIRWPKYWSFSVSISPSNEYSGLISFRMDWFDLLVVQGTLKSLLQHHSSKASILWCSAFFMVQLSHPYMTTLPTKVHLVKTMVFPVVVYGCESWNINLSAKELMLLNCGVGKDS